MDSYMEVNLYREMDGSVDFDLEIGDPIPLKQVDAIENAIRPIIQACIAQNWSGFRVYFSPITDAEW